MPRLSDYIIDCASGPFGSSLKVECFVEKGFPIIDGANLKGVRVTDNVTKYVTEEKARSLSRSIARKHDVIVTISGTLGQIAYIPADSQYEEYLCSQRQFRVTFDENLVDIEYLTYYFHTNEGQKKILAFANYVGVPALSSPLPNFKNIEVNFPPIETQHSVASILKNIDNKIDLNTKQNALLEKEAKEMYDYWFVQFNFPDEEGKPYRSSGGKMVWNEELRREVPEGWSVKSLCDICDIVNGATPSTAKSEYYGGDIIWITPKDLSDQSSKFIFRGERYITKLGYDSCNTRLLPKGSVIMSSRAPIGLLAIAQNNLCTNQGFKSFILNNPIDNYYLYYYIQERIPYIQSLGSGTTFKEVSKNDISSIPLLYVNDRNIYEKWYNIEDSIFKKQAILQSENEKLTHLRDFLLPMLMNGQVVIRG